MKYNSTLGNNEHEKVEFKFRKHYAYYYYYYFCDSFNKGAKNDGN